MLVSTHVFSQSPDFDDLRVYDVLTLDPEQLRKAPRVEVESELERLKNRNASDSYNLNFFREYNKRLCSELRSLRRQCPAAVRLIPSTGNDSLNCAGMEGFISDDGEATMTMTVTLEGDQGGEFRIEVGKLASTKFSSGTHEITFSRVADKSFVLSPRFMDIEHFRVVPTVSNIVLPDAMTISLKINSATLYDQVRIRVPSGGSRTYLEMDAVDYNAVSLGNECRITDETLLDISKSIHDELGGRP